MTKVGGTKTDQAYRRLRTAIEDGELAPGERLVIRELVDTLGMSPTPIREAMRLLQAQGLITDRPQQGMIVAKFSPDSVTDLYRVRSALEPLAVEMAAMAATDEDLASIRELHERFRAAVEDHDASQQLADLNAQWHRTVYRASHNNLISELIERAWATMPVEAVWLDSRARASLDHHEAITGAVETRDANLARRFMTLHVEIGAISTVHRLRALAARSGAGGAEEAEDDLGLAEIATDLGRSVFTPADLTGATPESDR